MVRKHGGHCHECRAWGPERWHHQCQPRIEDLIWLEEVDVGPLTTSGQSRAVRPSEPGSRQRAVGQLCTVMGEEEPGAGRPGELAGVPVNARFEWAGSVNQAPCSSVSGNTPCGFEQALISGLGGEAVGAGLAIRPQGKI